MNLNSLMIRASAGSGKTYQLSNRFLALLAAGVEPSAVIALTFTRKAAGEFADRILSRLAKGAFDETAAKALVNELESTLHGHAATRMPGLFGGPVEVPLDLERLRKLLENLVTNLHRVSLGTLDSFFVRIAKTFPYELGINRLDLLETDELEAEHKQVLARIFREIPEKQRASFLNAFRLATYGKEQTRLSQLLDDFLDAHHQRLLNVPDLERWGNLDALWPGGCPWPESVDFAKAAQTVALLLPTVRVEKGKPHATWVKGWEKAIEWFATYEPGDGRDVPSAVTRGLGLLEDLARGGATDVFSNKEHFLEGRLASALTELLGGYLRAELKVRSARTQGLFGVLRMYEEIYEADVRRRGRLGFEDVTRLLGAGGLSHEGKVRVEERLDARYRQWLLDEFQDTSRGQFGVLEGLLDEVVTDAAGERSLFVVGDTKQGIYAWRGGEPRLFDDLLARPGWSQRLSEWGMETSWRSAQVVLDLANLVCDPTAAAMKERFPKAALARWKYAPHQAAEREEKLTGYTVVIDSEAEESDDDDEASGTERALLDLMAEIQPIQRGLSCAILVRSNRSTRQIVDLLRHEFPEIPVEMDAEIELAADNPLGVALLDLFRWLAHPKDDFAIGHVERSPVGRWLDGLGENRAQRWKACRERVLQSGMAGLLAELSAALRASDGLNPFLEERLAGIARAAFDYDEAGGRDFDQWLGRLESLKQREYSASGAVQVMTLHKAKGLEFDMVVLPDLGGDAFDSLAKVPILEFKDAQGRIESLLLPPSKHLLLADPQLRTRFEAWASDQCYERFCNLYVALTRAKHATYVLLPKAPKSASSPCRYDLWLRDAVGDEGGKVTWAGTDWHALEERGDRKWFAPWKFETREEAPITPGVSLGQAVPRRERTTPSGAKAKGAVAHSPSGMAFGREVHAAFERVGWIDEETPALPHSEAGDLVRSLLAGTELKPWFEKRGRNVELLREQPVEAILDGKWLSGVMDRLHLIRDGDGKVVALEAIDFKTDAVERPEELVGRYAAQMDAYRRTLRDAFGVAEVTCVLLSTRHGVAVEC